MHLTHYTGSPTSLAGILNNGFGWVPNRRGLLEALLPQHDFSKREPQQFGMVCFTELTPEQTADHRDVFGHFGVVVSDEWAGRNKVQRVNYVPDSGPVFEAWRAIFQAGYADLHTRIRFKDDGGWLRSFENKAMATAVAGAVVWSALLQLYEYMETEGHAEEREWRAVNPLPDYGRGDRHETIGKVKNPQGWDNVIGFLKFAPADVVALVCPKAENAAVRAVVPPAYSRTPIWHC